MNPRAYSYVRFSTADQLKGKSLERQTEAAAVYAAQNDLTLDTSLSLKDLGVSAFRGKNASVGALSVFLARVADGTVPRGSFLLIETFDRMSRESAYDAQLTLQNIINSGVTVVTLLDGKRYSVDILRTDPLALIYAILLMSRSHEESSTKSKRICDAWARKRGRLERGEVLTKKARAWIRFNAQGKPELIPARAKLIREMFDMCLAGKGASAIASDFNDRKIVCWSGAAAWNVTYILRCLRSRAVIGEFQACHNEIKGHTRIRIKNGNPVKDYWPPVVTESMFDRAQQIIMARTPSHGPNKSSSILARLAKCPLCGSSMERKTKRKKDNILRYVCSAARTHKCSYTSVKLVAVDNALVAAADQLYAQMPSADPALRVKVAQVELQLVETDKKLYDLGVLLDDDTPPKLLTEKIRKLETAKEELAAVLVEMKSQLSLSEPQYLRDRAKRMRDALSWHAADPSDTTAVNQALHECFSKVVVNYQNNTLECVWKHGPTSIIPYTA